MDDSELISDLYRRILSREPDRDGLSHFMSVLQNTGDFRIVMRALLESSEYQERVGASMPDLCFAMTRRICIVDVGAQKLTAEEHLYDPLLQSGLPCRCIGFEPLGKDRVGLDMTGTDLVLHDTFIGDGSRQTFYKANDDATSSLLPFNEKYCRQFNHLDSLRTVSEEAVSTSRLDDVLADEPVVDLLKLDIQGFELSALRGARHLLGRTGVVHCEVGFAPIYRGQPYFSEIELYLRDAGFYFVDFTHLARYAYPHVPLPSRRDERLNWADAVFFRKISPGDHEAIVAQAAIAAHIYKKSGLAQALLAEGA